jgi:hypothetical protein
MKNNPIMAVIIVIAGIIVLMILGNYLIIIRAVPSLSEYMASTTSALAASSTDMTAVQDVITIKTPKGSIQAEIADTPALLEKGLGGRDSLPADRGMLFMFSQAGKYGFWMKDMRFPLDIVWMNADKTVVRVDSSVPPDSYPDLYGPPVPVKYVLEMNAGMAEKTGIVDGTRLIF